MYFDVKETPKQNSELEDEWYKKISEELTEYSSVNNANDEELNLLMEKYIAALRTETTHFNVERLKNTMLNHMHCFYQHQLALNSNNSERYLSKMSEILKIYCNLEIESTTQRNREVSEHILNTLLTYLFRDRKAIRHFIKKLHSPDISTPIDFLKYFFLKNLIESREKKCNQNKIEENQDEKSEENQDEAPTFCPITKSQTVVSSETSINRFSGEKSSETMKSSLINQEESIVKKYNNCQEIITVKEEIPEGDEDVSVHNPIFNMLQEYQTCCVSEKRERYENVENDVQATSKLQTAQEAMNLTIDYPTCESTSRHSSEFSNSPVFLTDSEDIVQQAVVQIHSNSNEEENCKFLSNNSNFYPINNLVKNNCESLHLPAIVPDTYDFQKNVKNEVFSKIEKDDSDCETRLPLKKRKLSVANKEQDPKIEEDILKHAKEKMKETEISYPATRMLSIAELEAEALNINKLKYLNSRPFKTPAERKEMPPLPELHNSSTQSNPIITEQYNNNHTYNNPTINYHMNNVPVPFFNLPCGSYYSLPSIILPFNSMQSFEISSQTQDMNKIKKEARRKKKRRCS